MSEDDPKYYRGSCEKEKADDCERYQISIKWPFSQVLHCVMDSS